MVVPVVWTVSHRQAEHWEPVGMRKGEYGPGSSAYVSGRAKKSK